MIAAEKLPAWPPGFGEYLLPKLEGSSFDTVHSSVHYATPGTHTVAMSSRSHLKQHNSLEVAVLHASAAIVRYDSAKVKHFVISSTSFRFNSAHVNQVWDAPRALKNRPFLLCDNTCLFVHFSAATYVS